MADTSSVVTEYVAVQVVEAPPESVSRLVSRSGQLNAIPGMVSDTATGPVKGLEPSLVIVNVKVNESPTSSKETGETDLTKDTALLALNDSES
jgi:hypothetical protein